MNNFWKYSSKFHINLINNFWSTSSNFVIFTGQLSWYQLMVPAKSRENRLRIDWDTSENWVKIMTKMPRDLWIRIVDSGCVAIATVLAFLSFFVWRLLTSESDVKKPPNSENRVFHISLNKGYIGKTIFSRSFSARYHILKKKKKKKNLLGLCRYSVGKYSLTSGDLPCQFELLNHTWTTGALTQCCFNDGPHFQRSGDVETVLFQCITLITFGILYQTSSNLQGSRRNGCEWCVQKIHVKRLRIDWDIN